MAATAKSVIIVSATVWQNWLSAPLPQRQYWSGNIYRRRYVSTSLPGVVALHGATSVQSCHFLRWRRLTPDFLQKCSSVVMQLMCFDFDPMAVLSLTRVGDFEMPVSLKCAYLTARLEAGVPR